MAEDYADKAEQHVKLEVPLPGDLLLRQVTHEDSQAMFDLIDRNRAHLSQNGDDTAEKYQTLDEMVQRNETQTDNELRFGIWDASVNGGVHLHERFKPRLVGFIKLTQKPDAPVEIGYYLDEAQQHRGIMMKSVKALTRLATDGLNKDKVMAKVALTNHPSLSVLQKAGYKIVSQDEEQYTLEYEEPQPKIPVFFSDVQNPHYLNPDDYEKIQDELAHIIENLGFKTEDVLLSGSSRLDLLQTDTRGEERSHTFFGDFEDLRHKMPDAIHGNPISFALTGLYGVISIYDKAKLGLGEETIGNAAHGSWVVYDQRRSELDDKAKVAELRLTNKLDLPDIG